MSEIKLENGQWYRNRGGGIGFCYGESKANSSREDRWLIEESDGVIDMFFLNGRYRSFTDTSRDIIEHLPDCTGFDWVPKPKLQLREGAWYGRKDGRIVGPCKVDTEQPNGYGYKWCVGPWRYRDDGTNNVDAINHLIREVEPPKPKYRAFANLKEFLPHRDKWVKYKRSETGKTMLCVSFSEEGILAGVCFMDYDNAFIQLVFEDGSPFGVIDQ